MDDRKVERLAFKADGLVVATIGFKDGPLAGPIFHWKIVGDRLVVSEYPNSPTVHDDFRITSKAAYVLSVLRRSGEPVKFQLASGDA